MAASTPVAHQSNLSDVVIHFAKSHNSPIMALDFAKRKKAEFSFNMLKPIEAWWLSG